MMMLRRQGYQFELMPIGMDGTPLSLRVVNDKIDPELARASIESVSRWRYSPTLLNGQPLEVDTTIEVNFTLKP